MVRVLLRNMLDPEKMFQLEVSPTTSIAFVKRVACSGFGFDPSWFSFSSLLYEGYVLPDTLTVRDVPLQEGARLDLAITTYFG
jgi:hypothetical protein